MAGEAPRLHLRDRLYSAAFFIGMMLFAASFAAGIYRSLLAHRRLPHSFANYWDELSSQNNRQGYAAAVAPLRMAAQIDLTVQEPFLRLAKAAMQSGDIDNQIYAFQGLVRLVSGDARPRAQLALLLLRQNKLAESEQQSRIALRLEPKNASAHCNLAAALLGLDRKREAAKHYREALRLDPTMKSAQLALQHALKGY